MNSHNWVSFKKDLGPASWKEKFQSLGYDEATSVLVFRASVCSKLANHSGYGSHCGRHYRELELKYMELLDKPLSERKKWFLETKGKSSG